MSDLIPRLLVCRATNHIPTALVDAILEQLPVGKPAAECRAMRDTFLREAAALIPGTYWKKAETLAALIQRFHHPTDDIRRLLWQAARTGVPLPTSTRQVFRVIASD
jgi:hypothetical protein